MLVLTRDIDQSIVIADNTRVTLLAVKGGKIRLGISAPDSVRVDREEVHARLIESGFREHPAARAAAPLPAGPPPRTQPR